MADIGGLAVLWQLKNPTQIANSPSSLVYRGWQYDRSVIVKILKPAGLDEMPGMDFLRWRDGNGAIKVFGQHDNAYLLEDGGTHTLRDYYDHRGDQESIWEIRNAVRRLHADCTAPHPSTLVPLDQHFQALFRMQDSGMLDRQQAGLLQWTRHVARKLLNSQTNIRPLHGDIHYGNFVSPRPESGWKAIDPKGLIGDPAYDFANIFGNPVDEPETVLDAERCLWLAHELHWHRYYGSELYEYHRDLSELKLLQYAAVHSVLSACWSLERDPSAEDIKDATQRLALAELLKTLIAAIESR